MMDRQKLKEDRATLSFSDSTRESCKTFRLKACFGEKLNSLESHDVELMETYARKGPEMIN